MLVPPSPPLDVLPFVESFLFRPELFLLAAWVRFFHLVPLHWYSQPSYRDTIFGISILFMLPLIWLWSQQYSRGDFRNIRGRCPQGCVKQLRLENAPFSRFLFPGYSRVIGPCLRHQDAVLDRMCLISCGLWGQSKFFMCLRWVAMGVLINLSPRIGGIQFDLTTHALRISHGEKWLPSKSYQVWKFDPSG